MTQNSDAKYMDLSVSVEERAADLVSRMTLDEKIGQMVYDAPAIERLDVPEYHWWNECLHGVGRAGLATVFPQAIAMAASFNTKLMHRVATAISDETRAKHVQAKKIGNYKKFFGLTCWSPNINIFRDPRWGRGQETYGEDPYLTGQMGIAFVQGLQGDDPHYLKTVASPKHYAVHSGPEADRHGFDAVVCQRDLRETYLAAFKACMTEGGAVSIMGAYNRTNGEACCASKTLLQDILRGEWGFDGYTVSDLGAIRDIHNHHKLTSTPAESAVLAVRNGLDLNVGAIYPHLKEAVEEGMIEEAELDVSLVRLFTARMRLGMFDPPEKVPFMSISPDVVHCAEHCDLARKMAQESIVLLKNSGGLLPLAKDTKSVAVIGPTAADMLALYGNYHGFSPDMVTPLEGITAAISPGAGLAYRKGCMLAGDTQINADMQRFIVRDADVVFAVMGNTPALEGEEGEADAEAGSEGGGDRSSLALPGSQQELLEALVATGKPVVLVLTGGSPIEVNWAQEAPGVAAILMLWYPGQAGGTALADVLFGDVSPAGRLPITFPKSLDQLPPFGDYAMAGRTYRYSDAEPLYPFGFGLSYSRFEYDNISLSAAEITAGSEITVSASVKNVGEVTSDEVAQLYLTDVESSEPTAIRALKGFERVTLQPGESQTVSFTITAEQMAMIDDAGKYIVEPGRFTVSVGGSQGDSRSLALGAAAAITADFEVIGERTELTC